MKTVSSVVQCGQQENMLLINNNFYKVTQNDVILFIYLIGKCLFLF